MDLAEVIEIALAAVNIALAVFILVRLRRYRRALPWLAVVAGWLLLRSLDRIFDDILDGSHETIVLAIEIGLLAALLLMFRGAALLARRLSADTAQLESVIESAQDAFISTDRASRVTRWNPEAEGTFGYSAAEAVGLELTDMIIPERHREAHRLGVERFLRTGTSTVLGTRLRMDALHKDGHEFPIEMTISSVPDADGQPSFHAFAHDISEQVAASQALEQANSELARADELKSHFLAMASHELRTPLASISGFTDTLLRVRHQIAEDDQQRYLEIIHAQAGRLSRLVDDLLTLSQIEAGKIATNPERTDVALAISEAMEVAAVQQSEVDCPPGLIAVADRDHFHQILLNYLGNAVKYGAEPIRVEVRPAEGGVEIRVSDAGPGVPLEFASNLFERFARAPQTADDVPGTGLGLSIVRGLARAQGGDAWHEGGAPDGSVFAFRLPAA